MNKTRAAGETAADGDDLMKIFGDPLFAKDSAGRLKSRVGTIFLEGYPALITQVGIHAMQRQAWVDEVDRMREAEGLAPLTEKETEDLIAHSVDLLFHENEVLIRPDPERMDLALRADEELQKIVSKRKIRFLNTHARRVRDALRARGENWRIARDVRQRAETDKQIERGCTAIRLEPIYHYNGNTGTRYLTVGSYSSVCAMADEKFVPQMAEIVSGLNSRNRLGSPDIDLFPPAFNPELRKRLAELDPATLGAARLREAAKKIEMEWRMALPAGLRDENPNTNLVWRAEMAEVLSRKANETEVSDKELIQGISPEFYRQIEWLPGGRVTNGQLIFDPLFDEYQRTRDPKLAELCDHRVRSIIFNLMRLFGDIDYVNIGRIAHSLARKPVEGMRRGNVYIVQYKEIGAPISRIFIIRFQKWGVAEHLDEGKDLLTSIIEANDYSDYIMDRRLACRQLGMSLPHHVGFGQFTEKYTGKNQYFGTTVRAYYYIRQYVQGIASDKVPVERFRNPAFALKFAELMGEAAALDLVVGRRATETNEPIFDKNYEVLQINPKGLPVRLVVTDHAGSFVDYSTPLEERVGPYAEVVRRRKEYVSDFADFAKTYVSAFERKLASVRQTYRDRRVAFDDLFSGRPYDHAGSGAYRWACVLKRLDECDPAAVAEKLRAAIQS